MIGGQSGWAGSLPALTSTNRWSCSGRSSAATWPGLQPGPLVPSSMTRRGESSPAALSWAITAGSAAICRETWPLM